MTPAGRLVHRRSAVFAVFRVAAGPRLGHGHLRRAEALAAALGQPACVSIRGGAADTSLRTIDGAAGAVLTDASPAVLVLDDPHAGHGETWCRAAHRRAIPIVSLHDLGLGRVASTLAIDGSITSPRTGWPAQRVLQGPAYAVIRPPRRAPVPAGVRRVLVSLGGRPRRSLVEAVVTALTRQWPDLDVFVPHRESPALPGGPRVRPVNPRDGLAPWFGRVDAAIVGGGVSLYEAVAAGVPTVALAVVAAQRPTIRGFAARRLALDGGAAGRDDRHTAARLLRTFAHLLTDDAWRASVRAEGPALVDGRGAGRVARAIAELVGTRALNGRLGEASLL